MITDVAGIRVGHHQVAGSGVTVVLTPAGTVGSGEVRGGAPASRELALLAPERTVARVDAVVLTGGSAFGLATADGVMRFLAERGQGVPTAGGPVPIVVAMGIFDLVASGGGRPGADDGYAAAEAAARGAPLVRGRVGAGTAATVGKWRGGDHGVAGGLGTASVRVPAGDGDEGDVVVGALAVVNAVGDVLDVDGTILAGSTAPPGTPGFPGPPPITGTPASNTTLVVVATDARLDTLGCLHFAQSGHGGLSRSIDPVHTAFDGDTVVALATGAVGVAEPERIRAFVPAVVAAAVRDAVSAGGGRGGAPGYAGSSPQGAA